MTEQDLNNLIHDKISEEAKKLPAHHNFPISYNGRGVCNGGELYGQALADALTVMEASTKAILKEVLASKGMLD